MCIARLAVLVAIAIIALRAAAHAGTAHVTFVLVNDIYQMTAQMMPDGQRRGGFARLAAVVKAARAKGVATSFSPGTAAVLGVIPPAPDGSLIRMNTSRVTNSVRDSVAGLLSSQFHARWLLDVLRAPGMTEENDRNSGCLRPGGVPPIPTTLLK
jgi:hypothetical protein